jgi:outer membrane protein
MTIVGTPSRFLGYAVCAASLLVSARAQAQIQISDQRLRELVEAAGVQAGAQVQSAAETPPTGQEANQGPRVPMTLDEAVKLALDRNLDIAVQRLNPQLLDVAIASARTVFHPSVTSNLSKASQEAAPTTQLQLSAGGLGVLTDTLTYNGGFTEALPWFGGSLTATMNNSKVVSNSNNVFYNPQFQSIWVATYNQPLLRNFKVDASRQQLGVAIINRDISDVQVRSTVTNIVSNVRNAYWDYVFATQSVEVARQSLDLANNLVRDNRTRVEVGTMAPIDVVQAQAEQATRRQALVTAESSKRTTELALKRLIVAGTQDPNWSATLDPVDRPDFRPEPVDIDVAVRRALAERTDLSIARKNVQANDLTLGLLRNQSLPDVSVQANYGAQGIGGPYLTRASTGVIGSTVNQVIPGGVTDAFGSLFAAKYPRWTVGLSVNYPLGMSAQDAAVSRARVQLSQAEAQIRQIELQVATDVTNAAIQAQTSAEAVQAAQAARELSQKRLEAEQSKFEVGMSTNYFVVQDQRDLATAQNNELQAVLAYRKSLVELERLQQTSLTTTNITILGR